MSINFKKNIANAIIYVYNEITTYVEGFIMLSRIIETIANYAKIDIKEISEETNILDLDVDSLCILKIIMDIESAYGVRFDDEEIVEIRTAKDIEQSILKKYS